MKKRKKNKRGRMSGLTAVTLVVVVFIVAVLAVMVLVALGNLRERANDVRVATGVIQVGILSKSHKDTQDDSYADFDKCINGNLSKCYGGITKTIGDIINEINDANADANGVVNVSQDGSSYCYSATLLSSDQSRCVDSTARNTADENSRCSKIGFCAGTINVDDIDDCNADVINDGIVDALDTSAVAKEHGTSGVNIPEDVNGDGVVDDDDQSFVANRIGTICPACGTGEGESGRPCRFF